MDFDNHIIFPDTRKQDFDFSIDFLSSVFRCENDMVFAIPTIQEKRWGFPHLLFFILMRQ